MQSFEQNAINGLSKLEIKKFLRSMSLGIVVILTTVYVFLHARNDWYGDSFLLILFLIALPRLFYNSSLGHNGFSVKIGFFFLGYLGLSMASVLCPLFGTANLDWLLKSFFRLVLMFFIVQSLRTSNIDEQTMLRWLLPLLCIVLSVLIILSEYKILGKDSLSFLTPWGIIGGQGNSKVYSFYLLFLMWTAVALLWKRCWQETAISIFVILLSLWALLSSTSESAQLAWYCSVFIFCVTHLPVKKGTYWIYLSVFMLFLIIPLLWVYFSPVMPQSAMAVYEDKTSYLGHNWTIGIRLYIYEFCSELIKNNFFFGHGFGSTLSIPVPVDKIPGWNILPGGHPHNIVFLILIEHGILGFLWLGSMLVLFFNDLYKKTIKQKHAPALWALIVSGQIVFSLSYSIWHPDVVLIYGFFFVFILFISDIKNIGKLVSDEA